MKRGIPRRRDRCHVFTEQPLTAQLVDGEHTPC